MRNSVTERREKKKKKKKKRGVERAEQTSSSEGDISYPDREA